MTSTTDLLKTPLHELHLAEGARMVAFAGHHMPVHYVPGVLREHLHTRAAAGLFDVSHMGQVALRPRAGSLADAARALERLTPADVVGLQPGRQRYALLTDAGGGILDDFMVAALPDHLLLVVNAACRAQDIAHLQARLGEECIVQPLIDRALLALQGPRAADALVCLAPEVADTVFMDVRLATIVGVPCVVSRSGYTGEDGFEISCPAARATELARALLAHESVALVGLGARDSLRLEAGLCLYGADIDPDTSPVEAALEWSIGKQRRAGGERVGGFPGADVVLEQCERGSARRRVGLSPEGRAPVRAGSALFVREGDDDPVGGVTSGGFGPSVEAPVSMAYVPVAHASVGAQLYAEVRGKRLPACVVDLPFVPHRYKRARGDR